MYTAILSMNGDETFGQMLELYGKCVLELAKFLSCFKSLLVL